MESMLLVIYCNIKNEDKKRFEAIILEQKKHECKSEDEDVRKTAYWAIIDSFGFYCHGRRTGRKRLYFYGETEKDY